MLPLTTSILVQDQSQIGDGRRQAVAIAENLEFGETDRGRVALLVTELATNLSRYATGGQILIRAESNAGKRSIEVISLDRGPGMNIDRCLADGYSTGGTSGTGLGAVRRLCNHFDIYSKIPGGTVIYCRIDETTGLPVNASRFQIGTVNLPAPHEIACGDTWRVSENESGLSLMVVDGLGHGPEAAKVAAEAARQFDREPFTALTTLYDHLHDRLRTTRGGAIAIAQIDSNNSRMKYMGVGNISGAIRSHAVAECRGLFTHNGTVGMQMSKKQEFEYPFPEFATLIMHSDGLQSRWNLEKYPGLISRHPAIISAVLYRDFYRGRDDVTVVVLRRVASGSKW